VGFRPSFVRLEHAGRRGFTLTVSLYGQPDFFERAGFGGLLVPPRPGYSRVRITEATRLPELLRAVDLASRERGRHGPQARPGGAS
jgi:hypothetical protein